MILELEKALLWKEADDIARGYADDNARFRMLAYLATPGTKNTTKAMIANVIAAMDSVWAEHKRAKDLLDNGTVTRLDKTKITPNPHTINDIAANEKG